ncbi:MAG: anhydro-N-acetylmuramic acid kinase [Candidatus Latescibacterota bacterium]|jgi:anhydro-N-acetylmuramic acid kinase
MRKLAELAARKKRHVVGLMSGTSADAVDAVLVELSGHGADTHFAVCSFSTLPLPDLLRAEVLALCAGGAGIDDLCQANFALGAFFAEAALHVIAEAGLKPEEVDLIGSHGQTVCHLPNGKPASTLQIGEAAVIAQRTGIITIADFRPADMAAGGQGAPLVPLVDSLLFGSRDQGRVLLNIGGIANVTILPAAGRADEVRAFDTGPGNMLVDAAVEHFTRGQERFDRGGQRAARGTVNEELLAQLLQHPYLSRLPPKSTGREEFGVPFFEEIISGNQYEENELVATLTEFTVRTIVDGIRSSVRPDVEVAEVWVAGGGVHNGQMMMGLRTALSDMRVESLAGLGVDPDAREALSFAVLANETLMGNVGNMPSATGALRAVVLGKVALP